MKHNLITETLESEKKFFRLFTILALKKLYFKNECLKIFFKTKIDGHGN